MWFGLAGGSRRSHRLCPLATALGTSDFPAGEGVFFLRALGRERERASCLGILGSKPMHLGSPASMRLSEGGRFSSGACSIGGNLFILGAVHGKFLWRILCLILPRLKHWVEDAVLCLAAHAHGNRTPSSKLGWQASPLATILRHIGDNSVEPWESWESSFPFPCCAGQ